MLLYITVVKHFVAENSNFLSYKIKKKKLSLNFEFLPEFQSFISVNLHPYINYMYTQFCMLIIHEKIHSCLYNNRVHQVSILLSSGRDIIVPV